MKKTYRGLAFFAAILLLFAMLFSELCLICEADHNCIGEECEICAVIAICESVLRKIVFSAVVSAFLGAAVRYAVFGVRSAKNRAFTYTPISLKVKLSN